MAAFFPAAAKIGESLTLRYILFSHHRCCSLLACRYCSSGTLFYDYVTCNMYAIVYTALPILLYGTYDRDISAETCLRCNGQKLRSGPFAASMCVHRKLLKYVAPLMRRKLASFSDHTLRGIFGDGWTPLL